MARHGHQQTAAMVVDSGWGVAWGGQSSRNSSDPHWLGREAGHGLPGGTLWVSFRLPSCSYVSTLYVCMYALSPPPPPLHTSSFLYFILSLTSLLTLPTLTLTSLHSHTPHTPHIDTEMCFLWWCGYWMTDKRNSSTPSHPHTLTQSNAGVIWSVIYITIVYCCVCVCVCVWDIVNRPWQIIPE